MIKICRYRKALAIVIIGLLLCTFNMSIQATGDEIIYVDDDNISGPWDGSLEHPYRLIQDAIDAADSGDTIFVFKGIYHENILVNKSIYLTGENKDDTIIDGGGMDDVIVVTADSVSITSFTIQQSGNDFYARWDAGIELFNVRKSIISGNRIRDNYVGIFLYYSSYNLISNNDITSNLEAWDGIVLEYSSDNHLSENVITSMDGNERDGVYLSNSPNTHLLRNTVSYMDNGIRLYRSHDTIISSNVLHANNLFGLHIQYSANLRISHNVISENSEGIFIEYPPQNSQSVISANTFLNNSISAYFITYYPGRIIWRDNFWERMRFLPKPIFGIYRSFKSQVFIPQIRFDFRPARQQSNPTNGMPVQIPQETVNSGLIENTDICPQDVTKGTPDLQRRVKKDTTIDFSPYLLPSEEPLSTHTNDDIFPEGFQAGDIVFMDCRQYNPWFSREGNHTDHCVLYVGFNEETQVHEFVDTVPVAGVRISNFTDGIDRYFTNYAFAYVANTTVEQKEAACQWAKNQCLDRNKPVDEDGKRWIDNYQYHPPLGYWKSYKPDGFDVFSNFWYCSELCWAAYYSVDSNAQIDYDLSYADRIDIDWDGRFLPWVVNPEEIMWDDDIVMYEQS